MENFRILVFLTSINSTFQHENDNLSDRKRPATSIRMAIFTSNAQRIRNVSYPWSIDNLKPSILSAKDRANATIHSLIPGTELWYKDYSDDCSAVVGNDEMFKSYYTCKRSWINLDKFNEFQSSQKPQIYLGFTCDGVADFASIFTAQWKVPLVLVGARGTLLEYGRVEPTIYVDPDRDPDDAQDRDFQNRIESRNFEKQNRTSTVRIGATIGLRGAVTPPHLQQDWPFF